MADIIEIQYRMLSGGNYVTEHSTRSADVVAATVRQLRLRLAGKATIRCVRVGADGRRYEYPMPPEVDATIYPILAARIADGSIYVAADDTRCLCGRAADGVEVVIGWLDERLTVIEQYLTAHPTPNLW